MSRCIVFLPYKLEERGVRARMLRPRRMIQAFRDIGYDVFVISGLSVERKKMIHEVKLMIAKGMKFDFMYAESSTMPTLLTDPKHYPTHPFMDFDFFRYIKKNGVKIGLFYCDVYWKFDIYGKELSFIKKKVALMCYRYDIWRYKQLLTAFYVPDMKVCRYLNDDRLSSIATELPPGTELRPIESVACSEVKGHLNIFYVGGISNYYQMNELVKAVFAFEEVSLTICCREDEWNKEQRNYIPYLCERITIVHKSSDELEDYYREADICSLLFKLDPYVEISKPFKAYEYLTHEIPVLSTKGTAIGKFVEEEDIGWNIDFDASSIEKTLRMILDNPNILYKKKENCRVTKLKNLWSERAQKVANDLSIK